MIGFPEYAKVGRIVAKENFYSGIDIATKNLFQNEISRITWEYKLAPNTINLPAKKWPEMEVFRITLKNGEVPEKVLKAIDSAIPYPILFLIEKGTVEKAVISYKEQSQKDKNFAKVDTYFSTEWNDPKLDNIKIDGLDIDSVFNNFVRQIAGDKLYIKRTEESLKQSVERQEQKYALQKQLKALKVKICKEKQLNKQISMNDIVKKINKKLEDL